MPRKGLYDLGFACPECGDTKTHVVDTRGSSDASRRRRRRLCENGHYFSTIEITVVDFGGLLAKAGIRDLQALAGIKQKALASLEAVFAEQVQTIKQSLPGASNG